MTNFTPIILDLLSAGVITDLVTNIFLNNFNYK